MQPFIEQQNIRIRSHAQGTFLEFDPEQSSRIQRQHAHRVRQVIPSAMMFRRARSNVRVLPASTPSAFLHTPPLTVTSNPPSMYFPSGMPVAERPSLRGYMLRSLGKEKQLHGGFFDMYAVGDQLRMTSGEVSTAPMTPGSRCENGRMAVVDVGSAARPSGHGRTGLLVGCIGVAD